MITEKSIFELMGEMKSYIDNFNNCIDEITKQIPKPEPEKPKYPMELVDLGGWTMGKCKIFAALVETCREWNRIDGFEPDWENKKQQKHCIKLYRNKLTVFFIFETSTPFCFKNEKTAQLFLYTFRSELEQVKDLI